MKGIPLFRFIAPKTLFANGTDYTPNEGFCPCRQSGLLNVSSCRQGESDRRVHPCELALFLFDHLLLLPLQPLYHPDSPVFISHPHFFNADPVLLDYVQGLSPNEEEHGLFIDIHPVSTNTHAHHTATAIKQQANDTSSNMLKMKAFMMMILVLI